MRVFQKTVATPGTAEQLTTTRVTVCGSLIIYAEKANMAANTGPVYFGLKNMNKSTGVGVIAKLASGASLVIPNAGQCLTDGFWVDADNANDGVRVVIA
mgnify:CR=1 FL=1